MSNEKKTDRPSVWIVGGGFEYIRLMYNLGYDGAKNLDDADIVLFIGGEDVNPELYGEVCMPKTHFNRDRDEKEKAIYEEALKRQLPMVGICRGGQFLNVMNGGRMWQHVTNHCGNHVMRIEVPPFNEGNKRRTIEVTSTHHQMMIPTDEALVLATANVAYEKISPGLERVGKNENDPDPDVEVVFYDDTNCLCFQPHPEMRRAPADCVDFFEECMQNYIIPRIPLSPTAKAILDQIPPAIKKVEEKTTKGKKKEKA
jgi:gamma-glutamyl-gamma-aminobutyrate hydrolase PuuD